MVKKILIAFILCLGFISGHDYAFADTKKPSKIINTYYKDKGKLLDDKTDEGSNINTENPNDKVTVPNDVIDLMLITQYHARYIFKTEIVTSGKDLQKGLSNRTSLKKDEAMLFHFGEPRIVKMWMKDTYFPLDMLFIGSNGRVVKIHRNAIPLSVAEISSEEPVMAVLEIKGGLADEYRLREGDLVLHQLLF